MSDPGTGTASQSDRRLGPDRWWTPSVLFPLGSPDPAGGAAGEGAAAAKSYSRRARTMVVFSLIFLVFFSFLFSDVFSGQDDRERMQPTATID